MTTRAEARRAKRAQRAPIMVAVISSETPQFVNRKDADAGAKFALALVCDPHVAYEWEWAQGTDALERIAGLVKANPPTRLRKHYRRLRDDLGLVPDGWVGFVRVVE